jgi:hypothetical protein
VQSFKAATGQPDLNAPKNRPGSGNFVVRNVAQDVLISGFFSGCGVCGLDLLNFVHEENIATRSAGVIIQDSGFINPISPLVRRGCFDRYPFSGTNFFEGEGVYFRFGMSYKFGYLDEPLVVMRDHLFNLGKAIKVNQEVFLSMLGRLSEEADFPRDLIPALNTCIARKMASLGWQAIRVAEDVAWARECFALALSYDRWQILKPRVLVGAVLSALPASLLHRLNIAGSRLQKPRHNSVYRDLFELTRNRSNKV